MEAQEIIEGGEVVAIQQPERLPAQPAAVSPLDLPAEVFRAGLDRRKENRAALMEWVRAALVEGVDYGRIQTKRGPSKPSLWKPGAEKICGMLGVTVHFPTLHDYEQAALHGVELKQIIMRCELHDASGRVVADGVGARSLKQDYGDINKALKMAEKSAHIDATLRMAGLSEVFTQDLEDMKPEPAASSPQSPTAGPSAGQPRQSGKNGAPITNAQHRRLEARIKELALDRERVKAWVQKAWGVGHLNEIPREKYDDLDKRLDRWADDLQREEAANRAALDEARQWGWSGDMAELPALIERIEKAASERRAAAERADGQAYYDDRQRAAEMTRLAARLGKVLAAWEAQEERAAIREEGK